MAESRVVMRIRILQHVPFEDAGNLEPWLRAHGHQLAWTRFYAGEALPGPETVDAAVVMGGPMSVHDTARYPWLADEHRWLERLVADGKGVLGVCLGAQQLALVLGGTVGPNPEREIGWFPVTLDPAAAEDPLLAGLPARFEAFHWHGETFTLPPGARPFGRSVATRLQGFVWGRGVVGVQFHLEVTPEGVARLIDHSPGDLAPGPYVQHPAAMLADRRRFRALTQTLDRLLAAVSARWVEQGS
ncbi:Glutamine amidotransferase type-1 domain-containing protein [Candidatus Hydrogenisulfobacillus filiaventi]|uniref:Glutamine amidotransferase type-1 domain-containing protein n=1 Tax=Candidatus Hydrogenisulfobacillus filiaventi TaxID=2707344 RepID=A0A6F8ZCS5_9FIRM|nr:Glutamine amidotransferase type-1 domain-containing protein [Candidatus Hydrogenisulfobacillus filiaventi]